MPVRISLDNFFDQEIVLENERVRLTPLKVGDFEDLKGIAFDPALWQNTMTSIKSPADLHRYIETACTERKHKEGYPFLIFDKKFGEVAGSTRYGAISFPNKRVEIGWTWITPKHQGTGLNQACKFELLRFAFEKLQVNRVELKTDLINLQSRKAILKIGAKEEGIFSKHQITSNGRIRDSVYYSIIDTEWPKIKRTIFSSFP
jgi:RimJ/RimL family protein N-acetyltransferase